MCLWYNKQHIYIRISAYMYVYIQAHIAQITMLGILSISVTNITQPFVFTVMLEDLKAQFDKELKYCSLISLKM